MSTPEATLPLTAVEAMLADLDRSIVGMRREAELLAVALATGRHIVLEGPPGTGKSTLLRTVARAVGLGIAFVEGNAELTPARLVGSYDPAMVLQAGYRPEAFLAGPLLTALQEGALLYIEEFNRVPEETLNVLITVLAEGEIHIPRFGHVQAAPGFRLIAAMNPFDAVGTARVSQAIADRMCRIALGYQSEHVERQIVARVAGGTSDLTRTAVGLVRLTRTHPDVRVGSSVRGAIDMVQVAGGLARLRREPAPSRTTLLDAALTALSGRVRLEDGCERTPEAIISELLDQLLATQTEAEPPPDQEGEPPPPGGGAPPPPGGGNQGRILTGSEVREAVREAARRTTRRRDLVAAHPQFEQISPEVGQLDDQALASLLETDPDAALALLSDMATATDPVLRVLARRVASRVFLRLGRAGSARQRGFRCLAPEAGRDDGDLDLERTLERAGGRPRSREDLVVRRWRAPRRAIVLLIDNSGSMRGQAMANAAVAAAAVLLAADERAECSVIAFAKDALVLQEQGRRRQRSAVLDDLLSLRGKGTTNLAVALDAAAQQLRRDPTAEKLVLLLSDCLATEGGDPLKALAGVERVHVLGTSPAADAVQAGQRLARRSGGRYLQVASPSTLARALVTLLA
ncbi:MAG: AAA family ATPase [Oscillochloridaceae bacterium umkhey_bin13]